MRTNQMPPHNNQFTEQPKSQDVTSLAPIVRVYEKIVLAGSEVRLVCPHAVAPVDEPKSSSFGTVLAKPEPHHRHISSKQQQQQLASYREKTKKHTSALPEPHIVSASGAVGDQGHEQIRWFRNHVPLRGCYKSLRCPRIVTGGLTESEAHKQYSSRQRRQFPPDSGVTVADGYIQLANHEAVTGVGSIKLNQATDLMQDGLERNRKKRSRSDDDRSGANERKLQAERAPIHRGTVAQANVNEVFQDEQSEALDSSRSETRTNVAQPELDSDCGASDESEWYMSEFGELVLAKVSRDSAGSYTCLHNGQLSEVLLDVLLDENLRPTLPASAEFSSDSNSELIVDRTSKNRQITSGEELQSVHSSLSKNKQRVSKISVDNRAVGLGSVNELDDKRKPAIDSIVNRFKRLEIDNKFELNDSEAGNTQTDPNRPTSKARTLVKSRMARANQALRHFELKSTTKRSLDRDLIAQRHSFMTTSSLNENDWITKDIMNHDTIQKNGPENNVGFDQQTNSIVNPFQASAFQNPERPSKWSHLNTIKHRPKSQQKLHLVESEIISSRDLESIPGLMYTKQQFYCPLMNRQDLFGAIRDQINLLVEKICRPQEANQIIDGYVLECATLANRLIGQLIEVAEDSSNVNNDGTKSDVENDGQQSRKSNLDCFNSNGPEKLIEVVWYKDGSKLEFDSNGRGLDKKLNVKLIDFIDRFEAPLSHDSDNKTYGNSRLGQQTDILESRGEIPTAVPSLGKQEKPNEPTQHEQAQTILCPPRGLILEIDGIRRLNAGHYSCALRFNNSRLKSSLRALRGLHSSSWARNQTDKSGSGATWSGCVVCKNDKSICCDVDGGKDREGPHLLTSHQEMDNVPEIERSTAKILNAKSMVKKEANMENIAQASFSRDAIHSVNDDELNLPIKFSDGENTKETTTLERSASRDETTLGHNNIETELNSIRNNEILPNNTGHLLVTKQIKTLRFILNGSSFSSEEQWNYLEQTISSPQPFMMVQTFLLLITERPANSCSLWSTIRGANDAYSRRKLTDFKRLKRSLMKPMGSTIDGNDGSPTWHHQPADRLENSNHSNGAHLIGRYAIKGAGPSEHSSTGDDYWRGTDSVIVGGGEAIHPNGDSRNGANIDGKLVASLSWLNGAVGSDVESNRATVKDVVRQERPNDDIDNARRRLEPSGQQNSFTSTESDDIGGGGDSQQQVLAMGNNEVQSAGPDKILHPRDNPFALSAPADKTTNGSLEFRHDAYDEPQFVEAGNISDIGRDIELERIVTDRHRQSTMLTNNANKRTTSEQTRAVKRHSSWPPTSENNVVRDARIPFNYANEHSTMRNLNPHLDASLEGSEREQAQTIGESFDLHLKTFDLGQIEQSSNDGLEFKTKGSVQVDTPGFDDRSGQHSNRATGRKGQSQRIDMKHEFSGQERRLVWDGVTGKPLQLPSGMAGPIDNSDRSINTQAKYVIDGNSETSQVAANKKSKHQEEEDEDAETSESDEFSNEVGTVNLKPSVGGRVSPAGQLEQGTLFDSLDDDQTNSLPTTTTMSSRSIDRISAGEFVTEKSNNIQTNGKRMAATSAQRRRAKFNNIGSVRAEPTTWMATTTKASTLATVSGRFGSDNFINFSRGQRRRDEKEQKLRRQWPPVQRSQRILDDQSRRRRREAPRGDTDFGTHDNDDALSIGHASRRQSYAESKPEIGHKLQPSRTEPRQRLSRSDKSAWSVGGGSGTSDRSWRHRRLASNQPDDKILLALSESPVETGPWPASSNSGKQASGTEDGSIQYGSNDRARHDDESKKSLGLALASDNSMSLDEIVTSPGATQELTMFVSGRQQTLPTANAPPDYYSTSVSTDDDDDSIRGYSSSSISNSDGTENDESLLWAASQYLYMHIRAFAASSLYGVQVDVEWSNENERTGINRTVGVSSDDDINDQTVANRDVPRVDFNESEFVAINGLNGDLFGSRASSTAPIATIELVSGQDLHLECTAQALGRLPEVNWYKKIDRIPDFVPNQVRKQMARSLGKDIYWPVTSLDLLDYGQSSSQASTRNFVCSQSVTIFDNLLNQTFTVVNSLKLSDSHYDRKGGLGVPASSKAGVGQSIQEWHHHLYACLVKADVRHEYATLGVNIRHASIKLPPGLSNRLRARTMSELAPVDANRINKARVVRSQTIDVAVDIPSEQSPNYDFLRQSQFMVPFGGVWVPIRKNGTHLGGENDLASSFYNGAKYSINPIMLSIVIASLSSLLIALIYFTMKSYRALTNYHLEDECVDCANKHLSGAQLGSSNDEQYAQSERAEFTLTLKPANSYCKFDPTKMSFEHKLREIEDDDDDIQFVDAAQQPGTAFHSLRDSELSVATNNISKTDSHRPLYEAHFHDSRFICDDDISTLLLSDMMSTKIKSELEYTFINGSTINNF